MSIDPASLWVCLADLRGAFEGTHAARRKAAYRWALSLPPELRKPDGRSWRVRASARLRDHLTVEAFIAVGRFARIAAESLPHGHKDWSARDRQRYLDTAALLKRWRAWKTTSHLPIEFGASMWDEHQTVAGWAEARNLRLTPATLYVYAARMKPGSSRFDGNVDFRGRLKSGEQVTGDGEVLPTGPRRREAAPDYWETFLEIVHANGNRISLAGAWRRVAEIAARDDRAAAWPSQRSVERRYAALPEQVRVIGRVGDREYRDTCEPTVIRDYEDVLPLDIVSLDGRTLDIMGRTRDSRRGWRRCRFTVTGVMDIGSRLLGGWDVRDNEHADGILCGVKMFTRDVGIPKAFYLDNGSAYAASLGSSFRDRFQTLLGHLNAELINAIPGNARAKIIESNWRVMKDEFDRWWPQFWGGKPEDRPEGANDIRIDQLPTIDDMRKAWSDFVVYWNHREHGGSGMFGLCPQLKFEQFSQTVRRADPDVIDLLCCRLVGGDKGVTVGKNGVTWNNKVYGHFDAELGKYLGRKVWLRIDPESAAFVTVCDERGVPLCVATNQMLRGATQDDVRTAMQLQGRYRKIHKEAAGARDYLAKNCVSQILAERRDAALARADEVRKSLPAAAAPQIQIVRPDLVAPAQKVKRDTARKLTGVASVSDPDLRASAPLRAAGDSQPGFAPRSGFARLAAKAAAEEAMEAEAKAQPHVNRWAKLNWDQEAAG